MELQDSLDLIKAFRRVDSDRRDDAFPDIVGYRDYKKNLDENLNALRQKIRSLGQYRTDLPLNIDLPASRQRLVPKLATRKCADSHRMNRQRVVQIGGG